MSSGKKPQGYTILEVMIFLVVTGVLLISALGVFQGRQQRTQFAQAVRETDQRIRTIINEVGSGYFPKTENFRCVAGAEGPSFSSIFDEDQGTNEDCIFIGKVIQFGSASSESGCDEDTVSGCDDYAVHVLAGLRQKSGNNVTSLADANPKLVPQLKEAFSVPYGINVSDIVFTTTGFGSPCSSISSLGFYQSLGSSDSDGDPVSGSQSVKLYPVCQTALGDSDDDIGSAVSNIAGYDNEVVSAAGVVICFGATGAGAEKAAIQIGGSGRQLTTDVFMYEAASEKGCA